MRKYGKKYFVLGLVLLLLISPIVAWAVTGVQVYKYPTKTPVTVATLGDISGLSGSVLPGQAGRVAYYPTSTTTVDDLSLIYTDGTYVGIGTTSPAYLLDVAGPAHFAGTGGVTVDNGGPFRTDVTIGHTAVLQAYDLGAAAYHTWGTLTVGNPSSFDLGAGTTLGAATIVTTAASQTLTNKTLTTPIISSISNTGTLTLPTSTDTLVGKATTDTLTNKTLTSPKIGTSILDTNGNILWGLTATGSAVNYITLANAATGSDPNITVSAGDTNRGYTINAAGTGGLTVVSTNTGPSTISRGLTGNNGANSGSGSDLTWKTAVSSTTLHVEATKGHINLGGTPPTISSCGTSPSVVGSDNAFEITVGSVSATGCTATFANAWTAAPVCTITNQSMSVVNPMTYTVSTTAVTITQTGLTSAKVDVLCMGRD